MRFGICVGSRTIISGHSGETHTFTIYYLSLWVADVWCKPPLFADIRNHRCIWPLVTSRTSRVSDVHQTNVVYDMNMSWWGGLWAKQSLVTLVQLTKADSWCEASVVTDCNWLRTYTLPVSLPWVTWRGGTRSSRQDKTSTSTEASQNMVDKRATSFARELSLSKDFQQTKDSNYISPFFFCWSKLMSGSVEMEYQLINDSITRTTS